ncbi:tight adherence protein B [Agromyces cerinus]|uniref:type II secretion system F family protein n=1 Tax=Agromyces cerinus TaxID=33878 RepID=UPI001958A085|nr:type II secretion system F family protein [Agromyces cerinus]MBM7829890.1 tight adherence protein B [Agromyces cerinus]
MSGRIPRRQRFVDRLGGRRRPDPAAEVDAIAAVTERLAVLLAAGVPAPSAWSNVGADSISGADAGVLAIAAAAARRGDPVAPAIADSLPDRPEASAAWPVLAAAWGVAAESGAPLAGSLRELAAVLRDEAQLRREVRAALAGPAASARLVMALPAIAVLFGATLGFDTLGVLFGNPIGLACLALGLASLWGGHRWNLVLAARAGRSRVDAGLELELLAIAMSSGVSIDRARALTRDTIVRFVPHAGDGAEVDAVLGLAARAGAPVAELLRAEAYRLRRAARSAGVERAAALGVRLMLPLGLCVLPAFVLLGVAPLMISVVTGTLGGAL